LNKGYRFHKFKSKTDYNEGTSIEILKSNLLKKVKDLVNKANYEYPTWFIFSQPKKFKLKKFKLIKNYYGYQIKRFRTTLDTFVDLQFLRLVSKKLKLIPGENNLLRIIKSKKIDIYSKVNQKSEVKIAYRVIQQRNK
jgi:spore coat polysaccharide biosynthesis protein SpsF (cytidylyltransferase family)